MNKVATNRRANAPAPKSNKKCDPYAVSNGKKRDVVHVEQKGYTGKNDNV